ncbi:hypothetical protein PHYPSEUDO_003706 [Phytophthora pseudosyringae]|uniref:Uncharacterized protein n=1 Tax=Phytophthora pseudosyringae TaxID=221518 RepID=A0A8T1VTV8_9STRA|nr:hypothetical protein PHYPSEUDO_003706 [Phytophthora pseudosyringae]
MLDQHDVAWKAAALGCGGRADASGPLRHSRILRRAQKPSLSSSVDLQGRPRRRYRTRTTQQQQQGHFADSMLTDTQAAFSSPSASGAAARWKGDSSDVSAFFFPVNSMEPTMPETFLELDPAGFFTHGSSSATKGSCASSGFSTLQPAVATSCCWLEPSREPCTDEIPWSDLVFWLGNASTGEVVCSCAQCSRRAMRGCNGSLLRQQRYAPYQQQQRRRVSSRVPVINVPRIEGVN